ncbi:putative enhancer of polycomb protein [Thermochaetoides thermophila DSM 1495]|uniref:Enhancer of polycomb-like protein n=1 Tax=Chaetomium thermophilum (strain DSM 1495 / CBS 144.50 / IMI 039719) TaxID=759272 RepID=G0SGV7_CHATD|nr:putative enhancer of polycomb protein [Thermochaetoides thermophila DSM 1495]EGS17446.1 putative enhancer of polycomb protein [Thermochaetoides thermophila DSM 1495]
MSTRKVRYKKLSVKTTLAVLREHQIDPSEYEQLSTEAQIATGVEQAEENEYHLQTVLKTTGLAADKEIPVPPPQKSELNYDELYFRTYSKPASYIRFSQTVEESVGCMYDMNEDDEAFLKEYNKKRPPSAQLSEDDFERIMEVYEETAQIKTPFAAIDQTIVPYDDMLQGLQEIENCKTKIMPHAKEVYEYWKSRRQASGNKPLQPTIKFETHQETDDMDPYVCFRRREVRQTRKTRARDVQSADKLKRLRKELEEGRQLVLASHQRELLKYELLKADRDIYETRLQLKQQKIRLGIKTDDEDLVNQKERPAPPKRKASEVPAVQRPPPPTQLRITVRSSDGRPPEQDLALLSDRLAEKENELRADIEKKVQSHSEWNRHHVDLTRGPLSPVRGPQPEVSFRPAKTQYLMTPPASTSSEEEPMKMDLDKPEFPPHVFQFRGVSQPEQMAEHRPAYPAYRRRIGRLNRLWIDRRGLASPPHDINPEVADRWKYDQSSDDEDEPPQYEVDPFDTRALKFRASIPLPSWLTARVALGPRPSLLPPGHPQHQQLAQAQAQAQHHGQHGQQPHPQQQQQQQQQQKQPPHPQQPPAPMQSPQPPQQQRPQPTAAAA